MSTLEREVPAAGRPDEGDWQVLERLLARQLPDEPPGLLAGLLAEPLPNPPAAADSETVEQPQNLRGRVFRLAAPVIGENLLQTLLSVADTILVASLGAAALAGVGASLQVIFIVIGALSAISVGASVLVAQAYGACDMRQANRLARQALIWAVLISLPVAGIGWLAAPGIIALFGMEPAVSQIGAEYLRITIATTATLTLMLLGSAVLRGVGDSRTPMLVTALANVLNVAISYVLIYGALGVPALGVQGSAWGTFIARLLGAACIVGLLWRGWAGIRVAGGDWRPALPALRGVMRIGLPAAVEEVLVITAIASITPIVATLGTVALAAHRVSINILSLSFLPGIGFGLAATALVGQAVGARNPAEARAVTRIATRWAIAWMGGLGLIYLAFAPWLLRIFSDDPAMIEAGASAIRVVALTQPFWAATFVFGGALRGTGNTRAPLVISSTAMWLVAGMAFLLVHVVHASLTMVWLAFLLMAPIEVFFLWWAWRGWDG